MHRNNKKSEIYFKAWKRPPGALYIFEYSEQCRIKELNLFLFYEALTEVFMGGALQFVLMGDALRRFRNIKRGQRNERRGRRDKRWKILIELKNENENNLILSDFISQLKMSCVKKKVRRQT